MNSSPAESPDRLAARYEEALEALQNGDLEQVSRLLERPVPHTAGHDGDPETWRRIHSAHARLHRALEESLESTRAELAKLRQGRKAIARMAPGKR